MSGLVNDLLILASVDAGRDVELQPIDLGALAHDVVRKRSGVSIRTDGHAVISGDKSSLTRLMVILLDNAAKYGGGHTELTVVPENGTVTLSVADDGAGIDAEHVDRLFERFYRADPARNSAGYGLGLAIAHELAHALGGRLELRSELGAGTRFDFILPARHIRTAERRPSRRRPYLTALD